MSFFLYDKLAKTYKTSLKISWNEKHICAHKQRSTVWVSGVITAQLSAE